jgi:hypothetical protein
MIKQGGGAIICTASVAGIRNGAGSPACPKRCHSLVSLAANQLAERMCASTGSRWPYRDRHDQTRL